MVDHDAIEGYALSPEQTRVHDLRQGNYGTSEYGVYALAEISGILDESKLIGVVNRVIERHEMLRTAFLTPETMLVPIQVVRPSVEAHLDTWDFRARPVSDHGPALRQLFHEFQKRRFDPQVAPAMHISLVTLSQTRNALMIGISAMCADSTSVAIISGGNRGCLSLSGGWPCIDRWRGSVCGLLRLARSSSGRHRKRVSPELVAGTH